MKYRELQIQTQREFPNNTRTEGYGWIVRAGYLTRENKLTPLGEYAVQHLRQSLLPEASAYLHQLDLQAIYSREQAFYPIPTGSDEIIHCPACKYTARRESALFEKSALPVEEPLFPEKVFTPDCHTIESLAEYLHIPTAKTAKAMMFTQIPSGKLVFVVIRGDMTMSETKLKKVVGEVRLASIEDMEKAGAVAGYASPIGLVDALIVVDDLIPQSANLVAGANEKDNHLLNTNCGRDYQPEIIADLALAGGGDMCAMCGSPLDSINCITLKDGKEFLFRNILLALAESHHDDKGLVLPRTASPFFVYLMHIPGKTIDTRARADEIYLACQQAGIRVLFDDREERAGVKFNDADLVGCPVRITIGERGLENGFLELKERKSGVSTNIGLDGILDHLKNLQSS